MRNRPPKKRRGRSSRRSITTPGTSSARATPLGEAQLRAAAPAAGGTEGLTLKDGDTGEKRSFNKNIVKLGRDSACDLVLDLKSDKKKIDKVHATFERREGKWYVIDNSKAGVWVNGQRISSGAPHGLAPGDEIDLAQRKKYIFG